MRFLFNEGFNSINCRNYLCACLKDHINMSIGMDYLKLIKTDVFMDFFSHIAAKRVAIFSLDSNLEGFLAIEEAEGVKLENSL